MSLEQYILHGTQPMLEPDRYRWSQWMKHADRQVAHTEVCEGIEVSTVFLGLNHQHGEGPPLVFETLPFRHCSPPLVLYGGTTLDRESLDAFMERYSTWTEAEEGHARVVAEVRAWLKAERNRSSEHNEQGG